MVHFGMKTRRVTLALSLLLLAACAARSGSASKGQAVPHAFQLRLAFEEPGPGRTRFEVPVLTPVEYKYIADEPVVTTSDLQEITLSQDEAESLGLAFRFTHVGRDKLAAATRSNVGKHLAIFLRGVLHSTPMIVAPMEDGSAWLYGHRYSYTELDELRRALAQAIERPNK
jgi:SecD-like export protein